MIAPTRILTGGETHLSINGKEVAHPRYDSMPILRGWFLW
jgi:hypothetical protein